MKLENRLTALLVLLALPACSSSSDKGTGTTEPEKSYAFNYENETVDLTSDLVVQAGENGRIGPGVTLIASGADTKILVEGELFVEGTEESPASLGGDGTPDSWKGIEIADGGKLTADHLVLRDALYGIHSLKGGDFAVDHTDIGNGFKAAIIESDGTFDHTHFAGRPPKSISIAAQVSIDDPNGTLTILDASPTVTNSDFDGVSEFTDMIRIGGQSTPTFDHIIIKNAHCGFHNFGVANNSPIVRNSVFVNLSYGVMAFNTKPIFENNDFRDNANDVGLCLGATADNVPVLEGNFYTTGTPALDASCVQIGTTDASPATDRIAGAGPEGL